MLPCGWLILVACSKAVHAALLLLLLLFVMMMRMLLLLQLLAAGWRCRLAACAGRDVKKPAGWGPCPQDGVLWSGPLRCPAHLCISAADDPASTLGEDQQHAPGWHANVQGRASVIQHFCKLTRTKD